MIINNYSHIIISNFLQKIKRFSVQHKNRQPSGCLLSFLLFLLFISVALYSVICTCGEVCDLAGGVALGLDTNLELVAELIVVIVYEIAACDDSVCDSGCCDSVLTCLLACHCVSVLCGILVCVPLVLCEEKILI